jgi:hypothetical protein
MVLNVARTTAGFLSGAGAGVSALEFRGNVTTSRLLRVDAQRLSQQGEHNARMEKPPPSLCETCHHLDHSAVYVGHAFEAKLIFREWHKSFPNVTECQYYSREPGSDDAPLEIVNEEARPTPPER